MRFSVRQTWSFAFYLRTKQNVAADARSLRPRVGERIEIQPGMTATVEIKTGKNTVLGYLLKPISKTFGDSMGER